MNMDEYIIIGLKQIFASDSVKSYKLCFHLLQIIVSGIKIATL